MKKHRIDSDLSNVKFSQKKAIEELERLNLRQSDVRKATGDTRERISRLFNNETKFSADDALRLTIITGKDITEFIDN